MQEVDDILSTRLGLIRTRKVEVVLKAEVGPFVAWLEHHAGQFYGRRVPLEQGYSLYVGKPAVVPLMRPYGDGPAITKVLVCGILTVPQPVERLESWPWRRMLTPREVEEFEKVFGKKPIPLPTGIQFAVLQLDSEHIELTALLSLHPFSDCFEELLQMIRKRWTEAKAAISPQEPARAHPTTVSGQGRPTPATQRIFERLKMLKEADPRLTQDDVAAKLSQALGEDISIDTVRYVCKEMNYKWERGVRRRW